LKFNRQIVLLLAAAAAVTAFTACGGSVTEAGTQTPVMGTIEKTIEDTGIVVFDDNYSVTSVVSAKILSAAFNEGDTVQKGQVLYTLDSKEIKNQISQTGINLEKANEAYRQSVNAVRDLTVKSFASGLVTKVYCHPGDYVNPGSKIADVTDSENLILQVPFNLSDREDIDTGRTAEVIMTMDGSLIQGTVIKVFESPQAFDGRQFGVNVEIAVANPGALKQGDIAFARIGELASVTSGTLKNKTEQTISATQSGQVAEVKIREGGNISAGETVMQIKNDSLQNAVNTAAINVKDIQNTLSQLKNKLSDYQITAPVDGVVINKLYKESDLASAGTPLAVLADDGKLYIESDIDEMYISDVMPGQSVTAAVQGREDAAYTGGVVSISDSGTAKNGVTYYTVKISLDNPEGLMEGMNMDVKITAVSKDNVMMIPLKALKGNKVMVLNKNKPVEKEVSVGIRNKQYAEILSGLSADDNVIIGADNNK
jgi:HlyD family secretion protein